MSNLNNDVPAEGNATGDIDLSVTICANKEEQLQAVAAAINETDKEYPSQETITVEDEPISASNNNITTNDMAAVQGVVTEGLVSVETPANDDSIINASAAQFAAADEAARIQAAAAAAEELVSVETTTATKSIVAMDITQEQEEDEDRGGVSVLSEEQTNAALVALQEVREK